MVAGSIFMSIIEMNVQILLAEPVSLINQKIFIRLYLAWDHKSKKNVLISVTCTAYFQILILS